MIYFLSWLGKAYVAAVAKQLQNREEPCAYFWSRCARLGVPFMYGFLAKQTICKPKTYKYVPFTFRTNRSCPYVQPIAYKSEICNTFFRTNLRFVRRGRHVRSLRVVSPCTDCASPSHKSKICAEQRCCVCVPFWEAKYVHVRATPLVRTTCNW